MFYSLHLPLESLIQRIVLLFVEADCAEDILAIKIFLGFCASVVYLHTR